MEEEYDSSSLGKQGIPVGKFRTAGIGYVVMPPTIPRADYISTCIRTSTVMLRGEDGDSFTRVHIDKNSFKEIVFPETTDQRGSTVVWIGIPKHNIPIGIGILNSKGELNSISRENQIKFTKSTKSGIVDIDGNADTPELTLTVNSVVKGLGKVRINIVNPDETAILEVNVKGSVNLTATKKINLSSKQDFEINILDEDNNVKAFSSYKLGTGFSFKDEFGNEFDTVSSGFTVKNTNEDLKKLFADFLTEVENAIITTPAGAGTVSPTTITKLKDLNTRLNKLFA